MSVRSMLTYGMSTQMKTFRMDEIICSKLVPRGSSSLNVKGAISAYTQANITFTLDLLELHPRR